MNAMVPLNVIRWAAEECKRQESGEMSVYRMCDAWSFLANGDYPRGNSGEPITKDLVLMVGHLLDLRNTGWRSVPARFKDNPNPALAPEFIDRQIDLLLENQGEMTPIEFYKAFEEIHPFADSNGREGSLLLNLLNGTLNNPITPPDVFGSH